MCSHRLSHTPPVALLPLLLYSQVMDGVSVYEARLRMGEVLAKKILKQFPNHDIGTRTPPAASCSPPFSHAVVMPPSSPPCLPPFLLPSSPVSPPPRLLSSFPLSHPYLNSFLTLASLPLFADIVMPIPETSRTSALQVATTLQRPYREGFVKNRYIARTFIMPVRTVLVEKCFILRAWGSVEAFIVRLSAVCQSAVCCQSVCVRAAA